MESTVICKNCDSAAIYEDEDGYFYCKICGVQVDDLRATRVSDEDLIGKRAIYRPEYTRRKPSEPITPSQPRTEASMGDPHITTIPRREYRKQFQLRFSINGVKITGVLSTGACSNQIPFSLAETLVTDIEAVLDRTKASTTCAFDGTVAVTEGVILTTIEWEDFKIEAEFDVMKEECTIVLGRPFLATVGAVINIPAHLTLYKYLNRAENKIGETLAVKEDPGELTIAFKINGQCLTALLRNGGFENHMSFCLAQKLVPNIGVVMDKSRAETFNRADGSKGVIEGHLLMTIELGNFRIETEFTISKAVMDSPAYTVLGGSFLATVGAILNFDKRIVVFKELNNSRFDFELLEKVTLGW